MEIGGRPAAVVYEEQLGLAPGALTIEFWATSQFHPFGVLQPDGSLVIRAGADRTPQDTIVTRAPIPAGSAIQIMQGNADTLLESAAEVAVAALADRGDEVGVLLTWSCGLRQFVLGERTHEEPQRLQAAAGDVPTFGFYTYGEFARTNCVLGSHQATLTAIAL